MRLRVAILLSLLVIGGLISAVQPAQAGQWAAQLTISCQAKKVTGAGLGTVTNDLTGLTYPEPVGSNSLDVLYTVLCGKHNNGGHVKHVGPGGTVPGTNAPTMCVATVQSPNGKKHTPKAPTLRSLPASTNLAVNQSFANCLILAIALVGPDPDDNGNCGLSDGKVRGVVHTAWVNAQGNKVWELKYFQGSWTDAVGGILNIVGTAGKIVKAEGDPGDPFRAVVAAQPDLVRKLESCLPPGTDAFQVQGGAVVLGLTPKTKG